jgi:putative flippase GtrA
MIDPDRTKSIIRLIDRLFIVVTKPVFAVAGRMGMNLKELERFVKFMVVGTIGFCVDFGTLNLLVLVAGLPVLAANACSFSLAVLSNFTWNRLWTYPESRCKPIRSQLAQFAVVNVAGLGVNTLVMWALTPFFTDLVGKLGYNLSKAIATIVVLFWNFFVNRYWTYRDVDRLPAGSEPLPPRPESCAGGKGG